MKGSGRSPCAPPPTSWPPPPPPGVPLQYSAFLHAFLAPKELAAVDALGGPGTPAVPLGAQWVAGQALAHCSEEEGVRGDSYGRFQVPWRLVGGGGGEFVGVALG